MNSRRPQGEGPDGLPGYVWTDEPPDPTTFTLTLPRAVAERPRCALKTTRPSRGQPPEGRVSGWTRVEARCH